MFPWYTSNSRCFPKGGRQCPFYPQTINFQGWLWGRGDVPALSFSSLSRANVFGMAKRVAPQGWWVWWAGRCRPVCASCAVPQTCSVQFQMPSPCSLGLCPSVCPLEARLFPAHLYPLHPRPLHRGDAGRLHSLGSVCRPGEGRADLCLACVWSRKPRQKSTAGREGNDFGLGCGLVLA